MFETASLRLPLLAAEQAQKHVTVNEALAALDAFVQLAVKDRDLAAPPGAPAEGDRYIVAASPTGAWAGHAGQVAAWQDGAWAFYTPQEGWLAWVMDEDVALVHSGTAWDGIAGSITALQNLTLLGIGTTADATNPFSAKLNKALWTAKTAAEGGDGDLRYTLNKETATDVLSLLLQRGFSGRAELGLIGDDNLTLKVSPDGSTWTTALTVDRTTGLVTVAQPQAFGSSVRALVATSGNVALSGEQTIDGVLTATSIVLVRAQTSASANGLYRTAAGAWSRLPGFMTFDAHPGILVVVQRGTAFADSIWLCTSDPGGTLGTTALDFTAQNAPLATDTTAGIVELATAAETQQGILSDRAVPAAALGAFAAFSAYKSGAQTGVANNTVTLVTFDSELFDAGSCYETATSRWTPPAGVVEMHSSLRFNPTNLVDGTRFSLGFRKNGSVWYNCSIVFNTAGGQPQGSTISLVDQCNGSDYYEVFVQQITGNTCTIDSSTAMFSGARLR